MSSLSKQRLRELIIEAYDAGYHGCLDFKEEYADEVFESVFNEPEIGQWRVYKIKELIAMPEGTKFTHKRLGDCCIKGSSLKSKCMIFTAGASPKYFAEDSYPWDEPMIQNSN